MTDTAQTSACRFLAEVLLYPEDRDVAKLAAHAEAAGLAAPEWRDAIEALMASPETDDSDIYLETFEIGAKCPLYLGHYLFEEPRACSGAGVSGRNSYMIQLKNLYRHFGFDLQGGELPDYLPLMLDFLALTAGHPARKHRRLLVKQFMRPALPALCKKLREANNVYASVADILEQLIQAELEQLAAAAPPSLVAQVSQPAVSPISKSAGRPTSRESAGLETRDTADREVCATEASPSLLAQPQQAGPPTVIPSSPLSDL
jgi:nitrate reductase delta subunit